MFLHAGASLHGHEFTTPHSPNLQRKKPFLRSALPHPILRSSTKKPTTIATAVPETQSPPQRPVPRRRPVSEGYVPRPITELFPIDETPRRPRASTRTSATSPPTVRFKGVDVLVDTPSSPSSMAEDDPSYYDSDASHASGSASAPRRSRRRRALAARRSSTAFLVAQPAPKLSAKHKTLFKTIRPRLLLQLQELAATHRPRPTVDVFPASLIAGPLLTARYLHRFPRLFGVKGELGPRDLILVKSEDYTAGGDDEDEHTANGRRQPVAVLSPERGQGGAGEIVLDDGSLWTCSSHRGYYSFVHVDESGSSLTARWVKRNPDRKRVCSAPASRAASPATIPAPFPGAGGTGGVDSAEAADYRYTFSIINPLSRRHPILATLSPQSMEVYDDYTTPSASSGRYPPTRPVSGAFDSPRQDPPHSPLSADGEAPRSTHAVDEDTKKLIMVTGLWVALQLGTMASPVPCCTAEMGECNNNASQESSPMITQSSTFSACTLPRRQTMSTGGSTGTPPASSRERTSGIRRAMSTGAAFLQRQRRREKDSTSEAASGITVEIGKMNHSNYGRHSHGDTDAGDLRAAAVVIEDQAEAVAVAGTVATITPPATPKQGRRMSWFKRLTHQMCVGAEDCC